MPASRRNRDTYNAIAEAYDRARPGYPVALFDDIAAYAQLRDDARILEIGCGSGQATLPMARRGYAIDAIELGDQLARICRAKLAAFPKARVVLADFETVSLPPSAYDLLMSATAFHWIDPAIRFQKAHDLLNPGGSLALFWHRPARTAISSRFLDALQPVYARQTPQLHRAFQPPPAPTRVTTEYDDLIRSSGLYGDVQTRRHYVATEYTTTAYIDLLDTFSDHRALPDERRRRLFDGIAALIDADFGGLIQRETVALLYLAKRL